MLYDAIDLQDQEIYLQLQAAVEAEELTGNLPTYYFKIRRRSDDVELGRCDLRIGTNCKTAIDGNLSFTIYPAWRGHHYAAKACRLLLQLARRHQMESLIITCRPENTASRKTCLLLGAQLQEIFTLPAGHDLCCNGSRMCRYKLLL
ncbi:MAG: GNAT family N-acetyltransferase [Negativicutes bacterium]|nr:GNAT family N-acetyltransferase [Negativicutes bacterium]